MVKLYRKPHQYKRKKSILKNRFFWLGFLILVLLFSIFYFLFFSNIFKIENIIITGEKKVAKEDLKSLIGKNLENKTSFLKTKSIFWVNLNELRKDILNNFPQIAEAEIHRGFPDALNIVVVERLGLATWCYGEQCFLLDNEGVIFEEVKTATDTINIIHEQNQGVSSLGEKVIEKEDLSKILTINSKLSDLKIPIKEFMVVSGEKLEVLTAEDWKIYLTLQKDIDWQITKLRAVLEEKIPPDRRKDLEYVELRFGNLAPFKYRD